MNRLFPNQVYAGMLEILKDNRLYHYSRVGAEYCHLNDEGKDAILNWIELMAPKMIKIDQLELDARAKQMVLDELKK